MMYYAGEYPLLIRSAEAATRFRSKFPSLGRMALLTHRDPRAVPMLYVAATTPAPEVEFVHYDHDEDPGATKLPLPGKYKKVASSIITPAGANMLRSVLIDYQRSIPASVWRLADAAMVGVMTQEQVQDMLQVDESDLGMPRSPHLNTLLGGGEEGLDTGLAIFYPDTGMLMSDPSWMVAGPVVPLKDFRAQEAIL